MSTQELFFMLMKRQCCRKVAYRISLLDREVVNMRAIRTRYIAFVIKINVIPDTSWAATFRRDFRPSTAVFALPEMGKIVIRDVQKSVVETIALWILMEKSRHNYEDHDEFVGAARPRFELQAGCLKVNGEDKVQTGCTVETQGNSSEVLAKHCICNSHLCNFHHLVRGTEDPRPKAAAPGVKQTTSQLNPVRLYTSNKEIDENDILSVMNGASRAFFGAIVLPFLFL
uniref:Phlebovirus_G2 domain-containing protein n=1 Tax=Caenorhabditis tropicalis TaxID=1561998 RepID=A0A1I7U0Z5_9PELO